MALSLSAVGPPGLDQLLANSRDVLNTCSESVTVTSPHPHVTARPLVASVTVNYSGVHPLPYAHGLHPLLCLALALASLQALLSSVPGPWPIHLPLPDLLAQLEALDSEPPSTVT